MSLEFFAESPADLAAEADAASERLGHKAAVQLEKLRAAAAGQKDTAAALLQQFTTLIKENPVPALLGAAALGFLLVKSFSARK